MTVLDPAPLAAPPVAADTADQDHHLLDLVVDLATLDSPDDTTRRLPDLLERLADETGARACQVDAATTVSRGARDTQWQTVASVGYSSTVAHHLGGPFLSSPHGQLVFASDAPLRIENNAYHFRASSHFRDVLQPAGYDDGVSLALRAVTGEVVGVLHLSARAGDDLHRASIAQLPAVGRVLARVTEVASCSARDVTLPPDYAVVHIDASGRERPVVGRGPLHLELDQDVLTILRTILAAGVRFASFLHLQDGRLVEVRVHSPEGRHTAGQPCIVATRPATSTLGLTQRQLEVLTAVATGAGNRDIADELCLTQRTVAAHVEAILARLDTPSRAGAAAKATAAGVLLPSADPDSVRSLVRILERPTA